jgi:MOSC domain-containing protein YiiM
MPHVERLSVKPQTPGEYGLPKRAVSGLQITPRGAVGDYNNYREREMAGDLDQALLLMTREVLDALRQEGWPVEAGDLGENLTLAECAEATLAPGVRLRVGEVELEISKACDPCKEVYTLPYIGETRGPAFVRTLVGRRGWYARVLQPGTIVVGAPVEVQRVPVA